MPVTSSSHLLSLPPPDRTDHGFNGRPWYASLNPFTLETNPSFPIPCMVLFCCILGWVFIVTDNSSFPPPRSLVTGYTGCIELAVSCCGAMSTASASSSHCALQVGYDVSALEQAFHPATTRLWLPDGNVSLHILTAIFSIFY